MFLTGSNPLGLLEIAGAKGTFAMWGARRGERTVGRAVVDLRKRTEPSQNATFTLPSIAWKLVAIVDGSVPAAACSTSHPET